MVSTALKKYAESNGFKVDKNFIYGLKDSYYLTISDVKERSAFKRLMIGAGLSQDDPRRDQITEFISSILIEKRRAGVAFREAYIEIAFEDKNKALNNMAGFLDQFLSFLKSLDVPGAEFCWYCNSAISGTRPELVAIDDAVVSMHGGCIESFSNKLEAAGEEFKNESKNYGKGLMGAIVGGIIGTIPWIIVYLLGYFVWLLGYLIGIGAKKGYEIIGKGRPGRFKPWIIAAVVVLCVLLAQFVGECIHINNVLQEEGYYDYTITDLPSIMWQVIADDEEYMGAMIKNILLGLAFGFASIYSLFTSMKSENRGNVPVLKRLS